MNGSIVLVRCSSVLACISLASAAHAQTPLFGGEHYAVGDSPQEMATADLDGDGDLDLAVGNQGATDDVSILINAGRGLFSAAASYPMGAFGGGPRDVVLCDLDDDAVVDLVTADGPSDSVSVRLGVGDGSFGAAAVLALASGARPWSVEAGDFDLDGDLDIAIAEVGAASVQLAWNDGAGGLSLGSALQLGGEIRYLASGDLDADGDLDLAAANSPEQSFSGSVHVLINDGAGQFASPAEHGMERPSALVCGDFDLDGDLDVLASLRGLDAKVVMLTNSGAGAFGVSVVLNLGSNAPLSDLEAVDSDADGDLDLLLALPYFNAIVLTLNDGAAHFQPVSTSLAGRNIEDAQPGDFDGDGLLDVVGNAPQQDRVFVLHGLTQTRFQGPELHPGFFTGSRSSAVADFDGDALDDLVTCGDYGYELARGLGDGTFEHDYYASTLMQFTALGAGDVDADGDIDLVAGRNSGETYLLVNDANGVFAQPLALAASTYGDLELADVDRDGDLDLVSAVSSAPTLRGVGIALNDGSGDFAAQIVHPTAHVVSRLALGDFDGDGALDVAGLWYGTPQFSALLNDGSGGFGPAASYAHGVGLHGLAAGDVDHDGDADLVLADFEGEVASLLISDGTGALAFHSDAADNVLAHSLALVDLDLDSRLDLVIADSARRTLRVLSGVGDGSFDRERLWPGPQYPRELFARDLDGDQDLDLVLAMEYFGAAAIYLDRRFPAAAGAAEIYCQAKVNSLGCTPQIAASGVPSASATSGFVVSCTNLRNQKLGHLFYGFARASLPFQCGTKCVLAPTRRTPTQSSGGSGGDDCSGSFAIDLAAFAAGSLGGSPDPALALAGTTVDCQWWSRDPGYSPPCSSSLSNAAEYTVGP